VGSDFYAQFTNGGWALFFKNGTHAQGWPPVTAPRCAPPRFCRPAHAALRSAPTERLVRREPVRQLPLGHLPQQPNGRSTGHLRQQGAAALAA
jgi:hypothetical protein